MAGIAYCLFLHPFWANSGTQTEDGQSDYADQFHIEQYVSDHDEDGDGVNDQTDMLQSTRDYIATKPKYKSKYYSSGYPDDGYGVCTDVVAFACKGSGYDLMQLVADDVQAAQDDYGIETPDANIEISKNGRAATLSCSAAILPLCRTNAIKKAFHISSIMSAPRKRHMKKTRCSAGKRKQELSGTIGLEKCNES